MADIPRIQTGLLKTLPREVGEWARQLTDSVNERFALVLDSRVANTFYAGPAAGADTVPGFRAIVAADLPPITASLLPVLSYQNSYTGTQVTGAVALSITTSGFYLLSNYVQWTSANIGDGLTYTQTWNDGNASHTDTTQNVSLSNYNPSYSTHLAYLAAATNVTFTTTQGTNPTFGTYQVTVKALQIG
jgi:hypothetical protein